MVVVRHDGEGIENIGKEERDLQEVTGPGVRLEVSSRADCPVKSAEHCFIAHFLEPDYLDSNPSFSLY